MFAAAGASQVKAQYVSFGMPVGYPVPTYMVPRPVVYAPVPFFVAPPPVVVVPPPVCVAPLPVAFYPEPFACGRPGWHHPHGEFRRH